MALPYAISGGIIEYMTTLEIPPSVEFFESEEEYDEGQDRRVRIEFYRTPDQGAYFVWPYIGKVEGDIHTEKHFQVIGHFENKAAARDEALRLGRSLIVSGFNVESMD